MKITQAALVIGLSGVMGAICTDANAAKDTFHRTKPHMNYGALVPVRPSPVRQHQQSGPQRGAPGSITRPPLAPPPIGPVLRRPPVGTLSPQPGSAAPTSVSGFRRRTPPAPRSVQKSAPPQAPVIGAPAGPSNSARDSAGDKTQKPVARNISGKTVRGWGQTATQDVDDTQRVNRSLPPAGRE